MEKAVNDYDYKKEIADEDDEYIQEMFYTFSSTYAGYDDEDFPKRIINDLLPRRTQQ